MKPIFQNQHVTLFCGDCREIIPSITSRVDLLLTDPPYVMLNIKWDKKDIFLEAIPIIMNIMQDQSCVAFFGRGDSSYRHNLTLNDFQYRFCEEIVWDKRRVGSPLNAVPRSHEMVYLRARNKNLNKIKIDCTELPVIETAKIRDALRRLRQGLTGKNMNETMRYINELELKFKAQASGSGLSRSSTTPGIGREIVAARYFMYGGRPKSIIADVPDCYSREHPTQKPIGITSAVMQLASNKGDLVLDPFAGSGTTGIAAIKNDRHAILIEQDEKYCEIIIKRIQSYKEMER